MTTVINGSSPSITFSDSTTQTTAFTTTPVINTINSQSATPLTLGINGTEAMRIDSSGNVGIGTTSPTAKMFVKGSDSTSSNWSIYAANSSNTIQFGLRNDNYFYAPSIASFAATGTAVVVTGSYLGYLSSSIRFKKDVINYDKGLDIVNSLRPVYYRSSKPNQDGVYDERTYAGFIAEEVKNLGLEEFIDYDNEGKVTSLKYGQMTSILCKAIQELNAKVDAQAETINALTARIVALEAK
jgi:hypothetical protein